MASCNVINSSRIPLIIILGSTGTGKTKLSIELAQKFGGEIISADSMQVYTGLDVITAKATKEERSLVPHHLIDIVDPLNMITVMDFRNRAVKLIDSMLAQNKVPIVVGGTNYYIESILWKILVEHENNSIDPLELNSEPLEKKICLEENLSSELLHKKLKELDPEMAERLHPNNKRKIIRSLEILKTIGRRHSDILRQQQETSGGSSFGGPLRYPNSLIFWLKCNQDVLDKRLNERVDDMMTQGLLRELTEFHKRYNENRLQDNKPVDYTKGIFQSIGFKEFHNYLVLNESDRNNETGIELLAKGLSDLKMVTRRYARKQLKWISKRFLGKTDRHVPPVYGLDSSDVSQWTANVQSPAIEIVESYMINADILQKPLGLETPRNALSNADERTYSCETCERVFVGEFQWDIHKKSKKHRKMLRKKDIFRKENTVS